MKIIIILIFLFFAYESWGVCSGYSPCIEVNPTLESEMKHEAHLRPSLNFLPSLPATSFDDLFAPYLGIPYVYGGDDLSGIDCSAFTQQIYRQLGISLPRTSREQFEAEGLFLVTEDQLQPMDLLFFKKNHDAPISHVAIYLGNGEMIHSSGSEGRVTVSDFKNSDFWQGLYYQAKRSRVIQGRSYAKNF